MQSANTLTLKYNLICLASISFVVDKIYAQAVQGLADYAQKFTNHANPALCLFYSEEVDSARLLYIMPNCSHKLIFMRQFVYSAANLVLV